jgi:AcrR family transcriptional regulator
LEKLSKGQITRNTIVERSRSIFNEKGLDITLDMIAQEMGLTKGRITNHFPTKESLFQAIMGYYEWQLGEYVRHVNWAELSVSMRTLAIYMSGVMDIQYENRCAIGYLAMVTEEKREIFNGIQASYKRNVAAIRNRVTGMVSQGLLIPAILHARVFPVFLFQYVNLLTNWVVSEQHYGWETGYESLKPIYLQGIMQCYYPYLTEEGMSQYRALNFSKIAKLS